MNNYNSIMMNEQLALKPITSMAKKWPLSKQVFMRLRQIIIRINKI